MNMVFKMYQDSLERSYTTQMTFTIVNLKFIISNMFATRLCLQLVMRKKNSFDQRSFVLAYFLLFHVRIFRRTWFTCKFNLFLLNLCYAPLIICFDLRFRNKFSKITIFLMCYIISVFKIFLQMYLMFTFLVVLCNLISVKGLMISFCQTTVWVLLLITLKE